MYICICIYVYERERAREREGKGVRELASERDYNLYLFL